MMVSDFSLGVLWFISYALAFFFGAFVGMWNA